MQDFVQKNHLCLHNNEFLGQKIVVCTLVRTYVRGNCVVLARSKAASEITAFPTYARGCSFFWKCVRCEQKKKGTRYGCLVVYIFVVDVGKKIDKLYMCRCWLVLRVLGYNGKKIGSRGEYYVQQMQWMKCKQKIQT